MLASSAFWYIVGFTGQALFMSRFLVQWIASERKKETVIPVAFWYLSLSGGIILLVYNVSRYDPVNMMGQAFGIVVYTRNLVIIYSRKRQQPNVEDPHRSAPDETLPEASLTMPAERDGAAAVATIPLRKAG